MGGQNRNSRVVMAAVAGATAAWMASVAIYCPDCIPTKTPEPFMIRGEVGRGWEASTSCLTYGRNYAPEAYDAITVTGPGGMFPPSAPSVTVGPGTGSWEAGPFEYAGSYTIVATLAGAGPLDCQARSVSVGAGHVGDISGVNFGYRD